MDNNDKHKSVAKKAVEAYDALSSIIFLAEALGYDHILAAHEALGQTMQDLSPVFKELDAESNDAST